MIRDPSDGSIKGKTKPEMTSALPASSADAKEIARLEASREWLRSRIKGGRASHAISNA